MSMKPWQLRDNRRKGKNYELEEVVSVNQSVYCGLLYYITFKAKAASDNGDLVTFQAKYYLGIKRDCVKFCRRKRFVGKQAQ